jgi:hypothetical protein
MDHVVLTVAVRAHCAVRASKHLVVTAGAIRHVLTVALQCQEVKSRRTVCIRSFQAAALTGR